MNPSPPKPQHKAGGSNTQRTLTWIIVIVAAVFVLTFLSRFIGRDDTDRNETEGIEDGTYPREERPVPDNGSPVPGEDPTIPDERPIPPSESPLPDDDFPSPVPPR